MAIQLKDDEFINIETMEIEKKPVVEEKKVEPQATEEKEEEEEKPEPAAAKKEEQEEEVEEKETEVEEESDKEEEKEEEKKEEEVEEPVSVDDFLAQKYAETFQINNEEDLDAVLGTIEEIQKENDTLKAELEEAKKGSDKPKFSSEQEEKAFNFIKLFPVDKMDEGMQTFAKVITMDIAKAEPRILLEEKFILENPELTRDEALRKFNRDYNKKYVINPNDYEDENVRKEEEEDRKIDLKVDVAKAKEFLQKKQAELKSKPKEADNTEVKDNVVVQKSIKANVSELDEYMKDFESVIFSLDDKQSEDFVYKLNKEQKKKAHEAYKAWIGNPNSYDAKGNLVGAEEVDKKILDVTYMLFGADMIEKALKHGLSKGEIKRAEQIASKKPDRIAKGGSGNLKDMSEEQQWEEIAKKKMKARGQLT
jgi:hypothetical protein